ncbi:MAG: type II toxin-antitoxin system HicB family antitoxin [Synergistaceae bacterium]|nr:type II toxin-antitoxin system HicB family antitoxin [Synergistaceae bacterium]
MTIEDYMNLPYTKIIEELNDESGHYFFGKILELDGCQSSGNTIEELNESLDEAMEGWLYVKLTRGLHIPLPQEQKAVNF